VEANGLLVVDKDPGPTSHRVVLLARRALGAKVGHTGTLDPLASGVLPLVVGNATRLSRYFLASEKEYQVDVRFGTATDTYDAEGKVVFEGEVPGVSETDADQILAKYSGEILQLPPMFSAIRVNGERLYKAARRQEVRERAERQVTIFKLEMVEQRRDAWSLRVVCSAGTYIRSLADDLGKELGCGGHVESLRRLRSGIYDLSYSVKVEEIEAQWRDKLIPTEELLPEFPTLEISEIQATRTRHGNEILLESSQLSSPMSEGACRLVWQGQFLAIGERSGDVVKPKIVLITGDR
jgi:tRNA pseudouridine55 synthase